MAGSQLKKLKATLKAAGLTGQTNKKRKGQKHSLKTPNETRRDDRRRVVEAIREQFNPFDVKMSRGKREDARAKNMTVGKPGISKQAGETRRRAAFDARMARKNKSGGIVDKRFGEKDSDMTNEEKMLERFTKERLAHSSKYALDDSDEDGEEETLTHYGQALGGEVEGSEDENEDEGFFSKKRGSEETEEEERPHKKTKAEVMKEVIAKSKYYKHLKQEQNAKVKSQVSALDEDFMDVMGDLKNTRTADKNEVEEKSAKDLAYDKKVGAIALSGRAQPTERTKTEEEQAREKKENLERLEQQRLERMQGAAERGDDDLDDDFWENEEVESGEGEEEEEEIYQDQDLPGATTIGGKLIRSATLSCPDSLGEFEKLVDGKKSEEVIAVVRRVFKEYQPKLAAGNKEKIGVFVGVLLDYVLKLSDSEAEVDALYVQLVEFLTKLIRDLAAKFPEQILGFFREHLTDVQERIDTGSFKSYPRKSDLVLYTIVGRTFSTSDMYHLVVNPAMVILAESLEFMKINRHVTQLFAAIYICDLLLKYDRVAKRMVPEVVNVLERVILTLVQEPDQIKDWQKLATTDKQPESTKFTLSASAQLPNELEPLALSSWEDSSEPRRKMLLLKALKTFEEYVSLVYKESSAFLEISEPFDVLLKHLVKYDASVPAVTSLLKKIENVRRIANQERVPLQLQAHRPIAIATFAPKFEQNYNPDKKHYDPDRERAELGKLQHQIKQERKQNMREFRRDAEFEARERIDRKKTQQKEYHARMSKIMNSVQQEEGTAKNEYEREKQRRKRHR